jgi:hypothetical protein
LESFVEDLNNLLNTAEVPNLFANDEKAVLAEKVRGAGKQAGKVLNTPAEFYAFFVERCKSLLHIVLAFSPIGDPFRVRLRQFPRFLLKKIIYEGQTFTNFGCLPLQPGELLYHRCVCCTIRFRK